MINMINKILRLVPCKMQILDYFWNNLFRATMNTCRLGNPATMPWKSFPSRESRDLLSPPLFTGRWIFPYFGNRLHHHHHQNLNHLHHHQNYIEFLGFFEFFLASSWLRSKSGFLKSFCEFKINKVVCFLSTKLMDCSILDMNTSPLL